MKSQFRSILSGLILAAVVSACGDSVPPPSMEDSVNTAGAGTQLAQAALTAMPVTPTLGPAVEYVTLTEEELSVLIDEAVAEAIAATTETTTAVTTTTGDDALSAEEAAYLHGYYTYADFHVGYAEQLLDEYYDLYSALAYEMIVEMNAIETALAQMNDSLLQISVSLEEIDSALQQGAVPPQEAIVQMQTAAQTAQANAQVLEAEVRDIRQVLEADRQGRLIEISQIQASDIPADRLSALQSAFEFIDFARASMDDDRLARSELLGLAQLGRNAQAGFEKFGGTGGLGPLANVPDLTQFSGRCSEITTQFALGEIPQARGSIDRFELSLGRRP